MVGRCWCCYLDHHCWNLCCSYVVARSSPHTHVCHVPHAWQSPSKWAYLPDTTKTDVEYDYDDSRSRSVMMIDMIMRMLTSALSHHQQWVALFPSWPRRWNQYLRVPYLRPIVENVHHSLLYKLFLVQCKRCNWHPMNR